MEQYESRVRAGDYQLNHIPTLPDAIKFVRIDGPRARQLADLALHESDLQRVLSMLEELNAATSDFVKMALWQLAVITFIKCFVGGSARIQLSDSVIYGKTPGAMDAFRYLKNIRDKHFVHDENAYAQCVPAAAINDGSKSYNIEKIIAFTSTGVTLDQSGYNNLHLATRDALAWIAGKFDSLCDEITVDLEKVPRATLLEYPDVKIAIAKPEEVAVRRPPIADPTKRKRSIERLRAKPNAKRQQSGSGCDECPHQHHAAPRMRTTLERPTKAAQSFINARRFSSFWPR